MRAEVEALRQKALQVRKYQKRYHSEKIEKALVRSMEVERELDQLLAEVKEDQSFSRTESKFRKLCAGMRYYQSKYNQAKDRQALGIARGYEKSLDAMLVALEKLDEAKGVTQ
jgi:hypothetical protein